jgi:hypothetical protein
MVEMYWISCAFANSRHAATEPPQAHNGVAKKSKGFAGWQSWDGTKRPE